MLAMFFWAFVVGGFICVIGQLIMDLGKVTPGHALSILVVVGAILDGLGLYEPLLDFAGAGASVPITSFGNSLTHGALQEAEQHGLIGVITGMLALPYLLVVILLMVVRPQGLFIGALLFRSRG